MTENQALVRVIDLKKHFPITGGFFGRQTRLVKAVDGISFEVNHGETLGTGRREWLRKIDQRPRHLAVVHPHIGPGLPR